MVGLCAFAEAGHYVASYSGGGPLLETGPSGQVTPIPYTRNAGTWGATGVSADPPVNGVSIVGFGQVHTSGAIMVTFTWTPDAPGDTEPAPSSCVVRQKATAFWEGDLGDCDNGLGDAPTGNAFSETCGGIDHYSVRTNPGSSFSLTCSPSADAWFYGVQPLACASGGVWYEAQVYPVRMRFAGVLDPNTNRKLLIGQRLQATVSIDGLTTTGINSFTWDITGGSPFINYVPGPFDNSADPPTETIYEPWSQVIHNREGTTTDAVTTCFAGSDKSAIVSCQVQLRGPDLLVTASGTILLARPTLTSDSVVVGDMTLDPNESDPSTFKLELSGEDNGIRWLFWATTPQEFWGQGLGEFGAVQLLEDTGTLEYPSIGIVPLAEFQEWCLDFSYPYPTAGWRPASNPPEIHMTWNRIEDSPGQSIDSLVDAINFHCDFEDFVMYNPPDNGVAGKLHVPLLRQDWHAYGTATKGIPWVVSGSDSGASLRPTKFPPHPRWRHVWEPYHPNIPEQLIP